MKATAITYTTRNDAYLLSLCARYDAVFVFYTKLGVFNPGEESPEHTGYK